MIRGLLKPDEIEEDESLPELNVSYKPQTISAKFEALYTYTYIYIYIYIYVRIHIHIHVHTHIHIHYT